MFASFLAKAAMHLIGRESRYVSRSLVKVSSQLVICPKCGVAFEINKVEPHVKICPGRRRDGSSKLPSQEPSHEMKEGGA